MTTTNGPKRSPSPLPRFDSRTGTAANPGAPVGNTYGDEMREDVTAGVVLLRNVIRALQGRVAGVPVGLQECVGPQVETMKNYLIELTDEFRAEYKPLADLQRFHESKAEKLAKAFAESSSDMPQQQMPTFVWTAVERLPRLAEFMKGGPGYETRFIGPLDAASEALRTAHTCALKAASLSSPSTGIFAVGRNWGTPRLTQMASSKSRIDTSPFAKRRAWSRPFDCRPAAPQ